HHSPGDQGDEQENNEANRLAEVIQRQRILALEEKYIQPTQDREKVRKHSRKTGRRVHAGSSIPFRCNSVAKWQRTKCPGVTSCETGSFSLHSALAYRQRGWKIQPEGGLAGLGTSPCSWIRFERI